VRYFFSFEISLLYEGISGPLKGPLFLNIVSDISTEKVSFASFLYREKKAAFLKKAYDTTR